MCQGGAEVSSTRRRSPRVNLRRSLWAGAWTVLSPTKDDHLSLLSSELKHLNIDIAALSEVRRPDGGKIMAGGYTNWSGRSDGYHAQGVAVAVSNKLTSMIIEVTPVNEQQGSKSASSSSACFQSVERQRGGAACPLPIGGEQMRCAGRGRSAVCAEKKQVRVL